MSWAILRALGKRLENLGGETPTSDMALRWLSAHQVSELVVLRAQHLTPVRYDELIDMTKRAAVATTLIYTGLGAVGHKPSTTLAGLLARQRHPPAREASLPARPQIPASHALRLRHDCHRTLPEDDFKRVDALLCTTSDTLERWLLAHSGATEDQLHRIVDLMRIADDPNQRHIRECAITLALHSVGLAPRPRRSNARPRQARVLTESHIDRALAYTHADEAAYTLAERLTGLPPDLLHIIGGDQISDTTILGSPVPERAQPILRALGRHNRHTGTVLSRPRWPAAGSAQSEPEPRPSDAAIADIAVRLANLMRGRRQYLAAADVPPAMRRRLDELRTNHIVELNRGVYRASHIALYSSYRLTAPPIRALTSEWDDLLTSTGNPADI